MKPRISVLTLGVDDLERAVAFYRDGLGLATEGIIGREFEHGAVAFFNLQEQVKLAVWSREDLAHDTGSSPSAVTNVINNIALPDCLRSRRQVANR